MACRPPEEQLLQVFRPGRIERRTGRESSARNHLADLVEFLLKGLLIGLIVALPFGPVGMLCLQRTLSHGARIGLASGFGAATSDALYGTIAAFGVQFAATFIAAHHRSIEVFGGVVVAAFGVRLLFESPQTPTEESAPRGAFASYWSAFLLSAVNPASLFFLIAAAAAAGVGRPSADRVHAAALVAGLFAGSMAWWIALAASGSYLRRRLASRIGTVERAAWLAMIALGLAVAVVRLVQ